MGAEKTVLTKDGFKTHAHLNSDHHNRITSTIADKNIFTADEFRAMIKNSFLATLLASRDTVELLTREQYSHRHERDIIRAEEFEFKLRT